MISVFRNFHHPPPPKKKEGCNDFDDKGAVVLLLICQHDLSFVRCSCTPCRAHQYLAGPDLHLQLLLIVWTIACHSDGFFFLFISLGSVSDIVTNSLDLN